MNKTETDIHEVISQLSKEENIDALKLLIDKLPKIADYAGAIEELSIFASSALNDKQLVGELFEQAEMKVEESGLNKQTLESIIILLQLTPKIVPAVKNIINGIEFINGILNDQESVQFLKNELEPLSGKVKTIAELISQTNERVSNNPSLPNVSIFKLVALLKDENVRKGYKYLQTFLSILSENQAVSH